MKITMYELLGMVKDGKELPKLENEVEKDFAYYVYDKWGDTCNLKDLKKILNEEVEILEEEKKIPEKLEDISEIKCVGCKVEINIAGNKALFDTDTPMVTEHFIYKINQLIKNQKKIIDYLKSKGE